MMAVIPAPFCGVCAWIISERTKAALDPGRERSDLSGHTTGHCGRQPEDGNRNDQPGTTDKTA